MVDRDDALLAAIMEWDECWGVNLRDNEPYYDLLWRIKAVYKEQHRAPIDDDPKQLTPLHIKLLRRGVNGQYIGLDDNMGVRVGEVVALGELHRMGFVENAPGPFPPGPPAPTPSVITDAGRAALAQDENKTATPGDPVEKGVADSGK